VTAIYARWHMFDEKREAVLGVETAVLPPDVGAGCFWQPKVAATPLQLAPTVGSAASPRSRLRR
jgi:hypothetical protein